MTDTSVLLRLFQQRFKALVAFLILVAHLSPFGDGLAVEDQDMEEGVQQKNVIRLDRGRVEQDRLAPLLIKRIRVEGRLNHDERAADVLVVENMTIEGRLVRRIVEDLQELASAKVKHELWIQGEVLLQPKGGRVILAILGEARAESDEHSIHPPQHVGSVVHVGLEDGDARHEHRRRLLIERRRDGRVAGRPAQRPGHGGDTQVKLTGRVLIVGEELHHALGRTRLMRSGPALGGNLKVHPITGRGVDPAHLPRAGVAQPAFGLAHR